MTVSQEIVVESSTLPNQVILVSFFSEGNLALTDEIKICNVFEYQSNENRAFPPFFWGGGGTTR